MSFFRNTQIALFLFGLRAFAASSGAGIANFYQVNENIYRGAQPGSAAFTYLANHGVKTVLDLREADERSRAEEKAVTASGMRYVNVPMTGLTPPTDAEIGRILTLLEDTSAGPVFIHCKRGADRTGAVIAAYRIQHDHWSNTQALNEAMSRGISFFQFPRQNYIRTFRPNQPETAQPSGKILVESAVALAAPATR